MINKITTTDCKKFLVNLYPNTSAKYWKRITKYKKDDVWYCDFYHPFIGTVTLKGESMIEFYQLVEPLSFATRHMDNHGAELVDGDPDKTILKISGEESITLISIYTEEDDLGRLPRCYSYDSESGRNYTIYCYEDGSYCYSSD